MNYDHFFLLFSIKHLINLIVILVFSFQKKIISDSLWLFSDDSGFTFKLCFGRSICIHKHIINQDDNS